MLMHVIGMRDTEKKNYVKDVYKNVGQVKTICGAVQKSDVYFTFAYT